MALQTTRLDWAVPSQVNRETLITAFIDDSGLSGRVTSERLRHYRRIADHFLCWLELNDLGLEMIDGPVIHRFLAHDCDGCLVAPSSVPLGRWVKRRTSSALMHFVRFLEQDGAISTPGELDDNFTLLDGFLERLRDEGYASSTRQGYYKTCAGLIVWLHLSRLSLHALTPAVCKSFQHRPFTYALPGVFRGRGSRSPDRLRHGRLSRFMAYLADIGQLDPLEPAEVKKHADHLNKCSDWLEHHRGLCWKARHDHLRRMAVLLPGLGADPGTYDAVLIRQALQEQIAHRSRHYAQKMTVSLRLYLRFLVSQGQIKPALVEAVPTVPRWRLSTLPRFLCTDDIERTIATCDDQPAGLRDRAILLLLARLALRAGDIVALCLGDIHWDRGEIRVSGKSRRQAALPLPQDAGDALHRYLVKGRPKGAGEEQKVFLRSIAPYRPLAGSSAISAVAHRAFDRAGITPPAGRGAHVFRHSQATHLLRSGATLGTIQALLRHDSLDSTMIYAKTDTRMLQTVAQPWIDEVTQ